MVVASTNSRGLRAEVKQMNKARTRVLTTRHGQGTAFCTFGALHVLLMHVTCLNEQITAVCALLCLTSLIVHHSFQNTDSRARMHPPRHVLRQKARSQAGLLRNRAIRQNQGMTKSVSSKYLKRFSDRWRQSPENGRTNVPTSCSTWEFPAEGSRGAVGGCPTYRTQCL